jgi:peptidoglycan/LPS O-acetylase OafA/YrhL
VLDGIRGWASLMVLLFHVLPETNRALLPELDTSLVTMICDGPLAVYVFFILSGEALSAGYLRTGDLGIVRTLASRRYFRLTVPILLASALVWLAMVSGLDAHRAAAPLLRSRWLAAFLDFAPSLGGLLSYALRDVYFDPPAALHYVPLLWTMHIELLGSCLVFGLLALLHGWGPRQRLTAYAVTLLLAAVFVPLLTGFVIGMLLGEARQHGHLESLRRSRWRWPTLLLALLLLFGISAIRGAAHYHVAIRYVLRAYLDHAPDTPNPLLVYANALGLFLLVALLPPLERFLGGRLSRFLGEISFPLYLVQFAVLITLTSWLVVRFVDPAHPARVTLYAIAAAFATASLLLAYGFAQVERRALRIANAAVAKLFG